MQQLRKDNLSGRHARHNLPVLSSRSMAAELLYLLALSARQQTKHLLGSKNSSTAARVGVKASLRATYNLIGEES